MLSNAIEISSSFFSHIMKNCIMVLVIIEILFYFAIRYVANYYLNPITRPPVYESEPVLLIRKILDDVDRITDYSHRDFFEGWFCGANLESIKLENMKSFLAWVMFASLITDVDSNQMCIIESMVAEICSRYNMCLVAGSNEDIRHIKMTVEPLLYTFRPMMLYVATGLVNTITSLYMEFLGFHAGMHGNVKYWHRPCGYGQNINNAVPLVIFHGITTGWINYLKLVMRLARRREVFLLELDSIKVNSLHFRMPTPQAYAAAVQQLLLRHAIHKVSVVGHSFGSITAGWFVRRYSAMVSHFTLIDPVSLLLAFPDVAYNFLYRVPKSFTEWAIHLVVSQEITIANTLRRNFWWFENVLWLEDIPESVGILVALAGADEVANAALIQRYVDLCAHQRQQQSRAWCAPISCLMYSTCSHAEILSCERSVAEIENVLLRQEKQILFGDTD